MSEVAEERYCVHTCVDAHTSLRCYPPFYATLFWASLMVFAVKKSGYKCI